MRKFFIYLLISFIALLVACGKSQEQLDAEERYSILQQENAQLKENMDSIKEDIQNARDNVELLIKMKNPILILTILLSFSTFAKSTLSEAQVKQQIINQSIASYSGNCPCPYNTTSNGSRCGRRSAYTKPGGYAPLCYDTDISSKMVKQYRDRNGL